jgi:heme oxygenase (biliverdin-IX-beta and delta-forming)
MILALLKQETARHHEAVELAGFSEPIMNGSLTPDQYRALLKGQYLAHKALEPLVTAFFSKNGELEGYSYQPRLQLIEKDLGIFGPLPEEDALPAGNRPASCNTPAEAVGMCYVLEGASMGGAMIRKALERNSRLTAYQPFHFFEFQKEHGLRHWRAFSSAASAWEAGKDEIRTTIVAAQDVFDLFNAAFRSVQASPSSS